MSKREKKYLSLILISSLLLIGITITGCGIIQGHTNPFVDKGIDMANDMIDEDGPVEEMLEEKIEHYTGFIIDLSPASEER